MGRKDHVQQTLPAALRNTPFGVVLLDYSCPDGTGDWAEHTFAPAVAEGRLVVERIAAKTSFHKTVALNHGARAAVAAGASHLCFVDADTHPLPGFGDWAQRELATAPAHTVFISALTNDGREVAELYGLLLLRSDLFEAAGGYAEDFLGWGCEDLEIRLRLALKHQASIREVPLCHLAFIQHPFEQRTANCTIKDWSISNSRNLLELDRRVHQWTGKSLRHLAGPAKRLTMQRHPTIYMQGQELQHFAALPELRKSD
jgi:hypothetical protein